MPTRQRPLAPSALGACAAWRQGYLAGGLGQPNLPNGLDPISFTAGRAAGRRERQLHVAERERLDPLPRWAEAMPSWAALLDCLPTVAEVQWCDLRLDTSVPQLPAAGLRVYLARGDTSDGHPWERTVYVEQRKGTGWWEVGYFNGDQPDPTPLGTLGDAYTATVHAVGRAVLGPGYDPRVGWWAEPAPGATLPLDARCGLCNGPVVALTARYAYCPRCSG